MTRIITTHLTISAPAEKVRATLTDLNSYRTWNPFIPAAAGTISVGQRLQLTIHPPGGRAMTLMNEALAQQTSVCGSEAR